MARVRYSADPTGRIVDLAELGASLDIGGIRELIGYFPTFFRAATSRSGHGDDTGKKLATKFRDAGRRSAPWRAFSSTVPGRPQDGADGNRISRWLLPENHKQYATEIDASLVEIKYYLEALSFDGAPVIAHDRFPHIWGWLVDHPVSPGSYLEPIQLRSVDFSAVAASPRLVTSGHLVPLDRGGRHVPGNTFLIYERSNQLQGNQTLDEFLVVCDQIVLRHRANGTFPQTP